MSAIEVGVERAHVLFAHAFHNQHHHVAPAQGERVGLCGGVYRRVDFIEFLWSEVGRSHVGPLANAANHGERSVEDKRIFHGARDVLIGVANGDGSGSREDASTDAYNDYRNCQHQRRALCQIVVPAVGPDIAAGRAEAFPHEPHQHCHKQHQVPVAPQFGKDYGSDVVLVGKLIEHSDGASPAGVLEKDRIHQVRSGGNGIERDENPFLRHCAALRLFPENRCERQKKIGYVDVEDGCGVENQRAA